MYCIILSMFCAFVKSDNTITRRSMCQTMNKIVAWSSKISCMLARSKMSVWSGCKEGTHHFKKVKITFQYDFPLPSLRWDIPSMVVRPQQIDFHCWCFSMHTFFKIALSMVVLVIGVVLWRTFILRLFATLLRNHTTYRYSIVNVGSLASLLW